MKVALAKRNTGDIEIAGAGAHLWHWFWELNRGRQAGVSAPAPLSSSELRAWQELTGNIVRPDEWSVIRAMDSEFITSVSADRAAFNTDTNAPAVTPASFDEMFS